MVGKEGHEGLHGRDVTDAGAGAYDCRGNIEGRQALYGDSGTEHQEARDENDCGEPGTEARVLLDSATENCRAHAQEEDNQGEPDVRLEPGDVKCLHQVRRELRPAVDGSDTCS